MWKIKLKLVCRFDSRRDGRIYNIHTYIYVFIYDIYDGNEPDDVVLL